MIQSADIGGTVRLADFIATNKEAILAEWVTFAQSSGPAARTMDHAALRDHASEMLSAIVADLRTPQTDAEQSEKSKGNAEAVADATDTAAEVHGSGRAESGFTVGEMVAEYRALRASVIRLWTAACGSLTGDDLEDLMRFNEAIDQSLAESLSRYTQDIDRSREMFVAILGHDLRTPLGAIMMSAQFILESGELDEPYRELVDRIGKSSRRMNQMVADLLDFSRTRLGDTIPIARADMDVTKMLDDVVAEVAASYPDCKLEVEASGELHGKWDCHRMTQAVTNLIGNAVQHGADDTPIRVTASGEAEELVIAVHNDGPAIPNELVGRIFQPMKRSGSDAGDRRHLGLGLYIVDRIVAAHEGRIDVTSSEEHGTTFTVRLPRLVPA